MGRKSNADKAAIQLIKDTPRKDPFETVKEAEKPSAFGLLTPQECSFVEYYVRYGAALNAFEHAYPDYHSGASYAFILLKKATIQAAITEYRQLVTESFIHSTVDHVSRMEALSDSARKAGDLAVSANALKNVGVVLGYYEKVQRVELTNVAPIEEKLDKFFTPPQNTPTLP